MQQSKRGELVFSIYKGNAGFGSVKGYELLTEAIRSRGHEAIVIFPELLRFDFSSKGMKCFYLGKELKVDLLIPRINVEYEVELEMSAIYFFQQMGVKMINGFDGIITGLNKLSTTQVLEKNGLPIAKTAVVKKIDNLPQAVKFVGGAPIILKCPYGTHGKRVTVLESQKSLNAVFDVIRKDTKRTIWMIQEFIAESKGVDYRAFVLDGKVIAAMKRISGSLDFRSNLHNGGNAQKVLLSEKENKIAVAAVKAMGLDYGGVDIIRSKRGPLIIEVNPCAGFEGITKVSGVDVADEIVKFGIKKYL